MSGFTLRRYDDPTTSADPRIQAVLAGFGTVALPAPRAGFRDELRAQLVAITPTVVAERTDDATSTATARTHRRRFPVARTLRVVGALAVVLGVLMGAGVLASRNALPGDALYSLKRGWEDVRLSFTHGTDRGTTYLKYSGKRADEVSSLVSRTNASGTGALASATPSAHTVELINSTLNSADSDLADGVRILTEEANQQRSAAPLTIFLEWAPDQQSVLSSIQARLPAGAARDRVSASLARVQTSTARARVLAPLATCGCFDRLPSDSLGPLPPGTTPTGTVAPTSPTSGQPTRPGGSSGGGGGSGGSSGGTPRTPGLPTSGLPIPTPTLPTKLPTKLPTSLPVPTSLPIPSLSLPHLHQSVPIRD